MTDQAVAPGDVAQRTDEWRRLREGRITGSRAGEAIGLIGSRRRLWRELTGREKPAEANEAMNRGTDFEPLVCAVYEAHRGVPVQHVGFAIDREFDWLGASPDGLVGDDGSVEFKFPVGPMYPSPPPYYIAQAHVVMRCTGRRWCDLAAYKQSVMVDSLNPDEPLVDDELRIWRIHWSDSLWAEIIKHLLMFRVFLETDTEPPRFKRGERPALLAPVEIEAPIIL